MLATIEEGPRQGGVRRVEEVWPNQRLTTQQRRLLAARSAAAGNRAWSWQHESSGPRHPVAQGKEYTMTTETWQRGVLGGGSRDEPGAAGEPASAAQRRVCPKKGRLKDAPSEAVLRQTAGIGVQQKQKQIGGCGRAVRRGRGRGLAGRRAEIREGDSIRV